MRHLARIALLDRNVLAIGRGQIDRRQRRGDVERQSMRIGQERDGVGADLVGDIAVGGDAVGADDDHVDVAAAHQRTGHAFGDDRGRDVFTHELPRRQPRALQERTGLVGKHPRHLALFGSRPNHAERGAIARCGEGAGVAVRQDARVLRHQRRAMLPHRAAAARRLRRGSPAPRARAAAGFRPPTRRPARRQRRRASSARSPRTD